MLEGQVFVGGARETGRWGRMVRGTVIVGAVARGSKGGKMR